MAYGGDGTESARLNANRSVGTRSLLRSRDVPQLAVFLYGADNFLGSYLTVLDRSGVAVAEIELIPNTRIPYWKTTGIWINQNFFNLHDLAQPRQR